MKNLRFISLPSRKPYSTWTSWISSASKSPANHPCHPMVIFLSKISSCEEVHALTGSSSPVALVFWDEDFLVFFLSVPIPALSSSSFSILLLLSGASSMWCALKACSMDPCAQGLNCRSSTSLNLAWESYWLSISHELRKAPNMSEIFSQRAF